MSEMTVEAQVGQMLLAGIEGLEAPDYILDWIRRGQSAGGRRIHTKPTTTPHDRLNAPYKWSNACAHR